MEKTTPLIIIQDIDHCGIVAGIIDQMGLVEQINQELGTHSLEIVSAGVAVKAKILNGLGLVSAPLYLFEKFFAGKATEHLLGERLRYHQFTSVEVVAHPYYEKAGGKRQEAKGRR